MCLLSPCKIIFCYAKFRLTWSLTPHPPAGRFAPRHMPPTTAPLGAYTPAGLTSKPHHAHGAFPRLRGSFRLRLASTCNHRPETLDNFYYYNGFPIETQWFFRKKERPFSRSALFRLNNLLRFDLRIKGRRLLRLWVLAFHHIVRVGRLHIWDACEPW